MDAVTGAAVAVLGVTAAVTDLRSRRVPNALTFGAAIVAVAWAYYRGGGAGAASSVFGWSIGLVLFLPFFAAGGMGAGDVKLLAAFGAWLGPWGAVLTAMWASLAGGVLAIVMSVSKGYLWNALRNTATIANSWRRAGLSKVPGLTLEEAPGPRLAYAVPIGLGALLAVWLGRP